MIHTTEGINVSAGLRARPVSNQFHQFQMVRPATNLNHPRQEYHEHQTPFLLRPGCV